MFANHLNLMLFFNGSSSSKGVETIQHATNSLSQLTTVLCITLIPLLLVVIFAIYKYYVLKTNTIPIEK